MVEAVVALAILAGCTSGFAYGVAQTLGSTRDSQQRIQASQLAARELEVVRNEFYQKDLKGQTGVLAASRAVNAYQLPPNTNPATGVDGPPIVIDSHTFNVVRTHELLPAGSGESPCDGGAITGYLSVAVNVEVTWSDEGREHSVRSNTLLTPRKGTVGTMGYLAVKLTGASGVGTSDVPVTLTGPGGTQTRYSAEDGCAVFATATAGTYSVTVNSAGYVNDSGAQSVTKAKAIVLGSLATTAISYDQAAAVVVTAVTATGYHLPTTLPSLVLANPGIPGSDARIVPAMAAASTTVGSLWPFSSGYGIWAGSCDQSSPADNTLGYPAPPTTAVTAGASSTASVFLAPVTVEVTRKWTGEPVSGVTVLATPTDVNKCADPDLQVTLGTTGDDGTLAASLPGGAWTLSAQGRTPTYCGTGFAYNCPVETPALVVVGPDGGIPAAPADVEIEMVVGSS